jgi:hypothetical protein
MAPAFLEEPRQRLDLRRRLVEPARGLRRDLAFRPGQVRAGVPPLPHGTELSGRVSDSVKR